MSDDQRGDRDTLRYHPETGAYRIGFDYRTDRPSAVLIEAVAAVTGTEIDALDPLYEVVDPDALDGLFEPRVSGRSRGDGAVTFPFNGCHVAVRSYGIIEIRHDVAES